MVERPSARPPLRVRGPRALREYILVPLLVVGLLLLLAVASIVGDQAHGAFFSDTRHVLEHFIGAQTASGTLVAIATGLVTVTSITFSVLLLAVQQTASSLSPVVFDQFVRRRSNQVYLGLFVGLALFSYVVAAAVQPKTPPIIGAFIATVLTVGALGCLLFLIYSTIDQMRPDTVIRHLHDRAVLAHDRETELIRRTRRDSRSDSSVRADYRSHTFGYIESIDVESIAAAVDEHGDGERPEAAEIELCVSVGQEVAVGDLIARVRHPDTQKAQALCSDAAKSILVSPTPDLDYDPRTALRDIANITWTSGSTAKQNPAIAAQGLHALRDLASRWLAEGDRSGPEPFNIVYPDGDVEVILDAMYSSVVVAHESRQHQQAIRVLQAYQFLWSTADPRAQRRIRNDVTAMGHILDKMPSSPALTTEHHALVELTGATRTTGTHQGRGEAAFRRESHPTSSV